MKFEIDITPDEARGLAGFLDAKSVIEDMEGSPWQSASQAMEKLIAALEAAE